MTKIVIVPVNSLEEVSIFSDTVVIGADIKVLKSILFVKLYEHLKDSHEDSIFPIWGVPSGIKSSEANKWNKISPDDVALFVKDDTFLGYGVIRSKFQSENVALALWPSLENAGSRQYLLTFQRYFEINTTQSGKLRSLARKGKVDLETFQSIDGPFSREILLELGFHVDTPIPNSESFGFGLTASEKKVVEKHAVKLAIEHLSNLGYPEIEDVGDHESFDLLASQPARQLSVEVKGSTGNATSVLLTRNEVAFQRNAYPFNGLFVVSNIKLQRDGSLVASGGDIQFISPWVIDEESLKPISYEYKI